MENRLIYKQGNTPETGSESVKFHGDGKQEYLEIKAKIESLPQNDLTYDNLEKTAAVIHQLYKDLWQSEKGMIGAYQKGDFFKELYSLVRNKWQLETIAGAQNFTGIVTKDIAQRFCFFADPEKAAKDFIDTLPPSVPEADIIKLYDTVITTATIYASVDPAKYTTYVRRCLRALYDHYDDPFGKATPSIFKPLAAIYMPGPDTSKIPEESARFRTLLVHQKDHFEFEIGESLDWLNEAGLKELNKQALEFYNLGKDGEFKNNSDLFQKALRDLGKIENSLPVNSVLVKSGLDAVGSADPADPLYYARPKVYLMLAWAFYKGLSLNPKATEEQRQQAYENHNDSLAKYPELGLNFNFQEKRAETANEAAEGAVDGSDAASEAGVVQILGNLNLGNPPDTEAEKLLGEIREGEKHFDYTKRQIILGLNGQGIEVKIDDLLNNIMELKAKLKALYGFDVVVALNPTVAEAIKDAETMIETFGLALQNAKKIPEYRKNLDQMEGLSGDQFKSLAGELRAMVADLQNMTYLPPEARAAHKALSIRAQRLYAKWATILKLPPKIDVSRSSVSAVEASGFYDEDDLKEYTYSPMVDVADESNETTYELPEVMHVQINRIRVIQSLAQSLFKVENDIGDMDVKGILEHLGNVEQDLNKYYIGDEYNGVTPFDLDGKLRTSSAYDQFMSDLKRLLVEGPTFKTEFVNAPGGGVIKKYTENSKLSKYLADKFDINAGSLDVKLKNWKSATAYSGDLLKVLAGGNDLNMNDVKKAASAIAVFQRQVLDDYLSARALMVKLLEPQLAGARKKAEEDKNLTGEMRSKAGYQATMQIYEYMENQRGRWKIESEIRSAYEKANNGAEMPADLLKKKYGEIYNIMINAQTEILYGMYLNWASISTNFLDHDKIVDPVDKAILGEFYKSVDPDGGKWRWSDEIKKTMISIGSFVTHFVFDLACTFIAGAAAFKVGGLIKKIFDTSRFAKFLLNVQRFKKAAELFYGMNRLILGLGSEAAIFLEIYPQLTGTERLDQTFGKKGWAEGLARLIGNMALFGTFHSLNWLRGYIKQGAAGKVLIRLAVSKPRYIPQISKVLETATTLEGEKAVEALKKLVPKLPEEVAMQVRMTIQDITLMQERWRFLIRGLKPDSKVKKVCEFLILDLHFDAVAMLLGGAIKNGIYDDQMSGEAEATIGQTILQAYGGALAFRGAFTVVKRGGRWVKDAWNDNSVAENLPQIKEAIRTADGEMKSMDKAFQERTVELRSKIDALEMKATALKNQGKEKAARALRKEAGPIKARLREMEQDLARAKAPYENYKVEMQERERAIEAQLTGERKLGDFAIPSKLARFLPKRLVKQLYKDYQIDGEFVGSDGLMNMLLSDFPKAMVMIGNAKRSLLSVNQVLVVSSRLSREQCQQFLEAQARIMTRREKSYFMKMVGTMGIRQEDIPNFIKAEPEGRNVNLTGLARVRESRWRRFLLDAYVTASITAGVFSGAKPEPVERPKPAAVRVVEASDFKPEGNSRFYIPEKGKSGFESLPKATNDSQVILVDGVGVKTGDITRVKEWNAKNGFDFLAQDQNSIFAKMEEAGIPQDALVGMTQFYENMPDIIKNYVKVFAVVDENGKVKEYYAIDQKGFEKELAALMPQIETEVMENFQILKDAGLIDEMPGFGDSRVLLAGVPIVGWAGLWSILKGPASLLLAAYVWSIKNRGKMDEKPTGGWFAGNLPTGALLLWTLVASGDMLGGGLVEKAIGAITPWPWSIPGIPIAGPVIVAFGLYRSRWTWDLIIDRFRKGKGSKPDESKPDSATKTPDEKSPEGAEKKVPAVNLPKEQSPKYDESLILSSFRELGIKTSRDIPKSVQDEISARVKAELQKVHSKLENLFTKNLKFAPEHLADAQKNFKNLFKLSHASLIEAECQNALKDLKLTAEARKALEGVRDQAAEARAKLIAETFQDQNFVNIIQNLNSAGQAEFAIIIFDIFAISLKSRAFNNAEMTTAWMEKEKLLKEFYPKITDKELKQEKGEFEKAWRNSHFTEKEIKQIREGFAELSNVLAENPGALDTLAQIKAIRSQQKSFKPEYDRAKKKPESDRTESDKKTIENYDALESKIVTLKMSLKGIGERFKGLSSKVKMAIFGALALVLAGGATYYFTKPEQPKPVPEKSEAEKAKEQIDKTVRKKITDDARRDIDIMKIDNEASKNRPDDF